MSIFFKACAKTKQKTSSSIKQQNQVTKGAQFSICYSTRKCKTKILKKNCPNTNMLSQSQMQEAAEDSTALIMNIIASSINHSREEILHPSSVVACLFLSLSLFSITSMAMAIFCQTFPLHSIYFFCRLGNFYNRKVEEMDYVLDI